MGAFIGRVLRQRLARPGPGGFWAGLLMALLVAAALRVDRLTGEPQLTLPLLLSGLLSAGLCGLGIPWIRRLRMGQVIREEGPGHHQAKTGTPTMGGLLLVPCGALVGGLVDVGDGRLLLLAATTLGFMAIGGLDDWQSLRKQHNSGLTVRGKLALQGLLALAFLGIGMGQGWIPATVSLPFGTPDLAPGALRIPGGKQRNQPERRPGRPGGRLRRHPAAGPGDAADDEGRQRRPGPGGLCGGHGWRLAGLPGS